MDGYAIIASDGAGSYPVISSVECGSSYDGIMTEGNIMWITTGAPLPAGANAVCKIEDTEEDALKPDTHVLTSLFQQCPINFV
jgi:molybdopterin biosynthesis enzyme